MKIQFSDGTSDHICHLPAETGTDRWECPECGVLWYLHGQDEQGAWTASLPDLSPYSAEEIWNVLSDEQKEKMKEIGLNQSIFNSLQSYLEESKGPFGGENLNT